MEELLLPLEEEGKYALYIAADGARALDLALCRWFWGRVLASVPIHRRKEGLLLAHSWLVLVY